MRIKLSSEQLTKLAERLSFEVIIQRPQDVRGLLEILGRDMPWDETGLSKFGSLSKRPARVAFSIEATKDGYICDIHPALAYYIHDLLSRGITP